MKPARKQLLVVFLAVTVLPAALAGWLAWRLLAQDRIIAHERLREIRERRADEVVQSLSRALAALARDARSLPQGAVKALDAPLAYAAEPRPLPEAPAQIFATGEQAELRAGQPEAAIAFYRELAASPRPAARAGAWLRLARTLRSLGRREEALQAYRRLCEIEDAAAGGAPAPLAGQWAICAMHEGAGRAAELKRKGKHCAPCSTPADSLSAGTFMGCTPKMQPAGAAGQGPWSARHWPTPRRPGPPAPAPACSGAS